jgi:hypothetical protein
VRFVYLYGALGDAHWLLTAVVEFLAAEIIELPGNAARGNKKQHIVPRHHQLTIRNDEELNELLGDGEFCWFYLFSTPF